MRLTEDGLRAVYGNEDAEAVCARPPLREFCVYGARYGEYIFLCARTPWDAATLAHRDADGETRVIACIEDMHHPHAGDGGCIPRGILYRSRDRRLAVIAIERAILAGEVVHHV